MTEREQRALSPAREREGSDRRTERRGRTTTIGASALVALLAAVGLACVFAGAALAGVIDQQVVGEEAASYAISASASANFPSAPSANVGTLGSASCSGAASYAYPVTTAQNERLQVWSSTSGVCGPSDAAEILAWSSPATLTQETVRFVALLAYGPNATAVTLYANLTVSAATIPTGYTASFEWLIGVGSPALPSIDALSVTVT